MSMCAGVVMGATAVLAADTRWSAYRSDGSAQRSDRGGKLAQLPAGFIALTGDGLFTAAVFEEMRRAKPVGLPAVREVVARVYAQKAEAMRATLPDANPDRSRFLVIHAGEAGPILEELNAEGEAVQSGGAGLYVVSAPPELAEGSPERQEAVGGFVGALQAAGTVPAIVRAFGGLFRTAAAHAESMSDQVELGMLTPGLRPLVLRGPASGFGNVDDRQLTATLSRHAGAAA